MAIYNEAYTLNELSKKNDSLMMESINRFFDNNQIYINETFNELNFQEFINEADGDKESIGQRIKSLIDKAIEIIKKIYTWIKNKVKEIKEKISNFFKNRKLKKEKPEQRDVKASPAGTKNNDDNQKDVETSRSSTKGADDKSDDDTKENKRDIKALPEGNKPLALEEPVDLSEIIDLMEKENFCPKLNAFAYSNELFDSIDGYISALVDGDEDVIKSYTDLLYIGNGREDYNNWKGKYYSRSAKSMLSMIRKKYYSDTITDKRGFYSDIHVDPEDSKTYDEIFKNIEKRTNSYIDKMSEKGRNPAWIQREQAKLKAITQAYNDVTRYQAQNLTAYNQFIEAIPRFADKVRANRRNKSND